MGLITLVAAYFTIGALPFDQSPFQVDVMVRGSVVESQGDALQAVAGARVYAVSAGDVEAVTTDDRGRFYFLKLLPGDYQFSAEKPGYTAECPLPSNEPQELDAGFQYLATVTLFRGCP